jgi:ketosteroid isomerase-like protein
MDPRARQRGGAVPEGILRGGYEALVRGDAGPLLALLPPEFEWTEPELAGYPLSGVHRGPEGLAGGMLAPLAELLEGLTIELREVVATEDREVVIGVMRGHPAGSPSEWELPFAHVWEVAGGTPVRATGYFDRSRLTLAASRRQLADVAEDLLEQAAEIRLQWGRLGDALRAAGVEGDDEAAGLDERAQGVASALLAAVDMAHDGSTREEVATYLREELGVEDAEAGTILDQTFDPETGDPHEDLPVATGAGGDEASRLARLFARNRG